MLTELSERSRKGELLLGKQEQRTHLVPLYKELARWGANIGKFDKIVYGWLNVSWCCCMSAHASIAASGFCDNSGTLALLHAAASGIVSEFLVVPMPC